MASIGIDEVLNFIIPFLVWGFIAYIIYRIPLVKEGVEKFRDWRSNRAERGEVESYNIKTITYE
jgi:hypothetical protein